MKKSLPHNKTESRLTSKKKRAFSLTELIVAIVIIGILTFMAVPNIIKNRRLAERNVAISRAAALNMAMASYVASVSHARARDSWQGASSDQEKFSLIQTYLAYQQENYSEYVPDPYKIEFPESIDASVTLKEGDNIINITE